MTDGRRRLTHEEVGRLSELAFVGASCAGRAFGMILNRNILSGEPSIEDVERFGADGRWSTGVIFEAEGDLSGLVAILLPAASRQQLNDILLGPAADDDGTAMESALREVGNIIASHTISGIADTLGGRILLSVPILVLEDVDRVLSSMMVQRGGANCLENELFDERGELHALLLFVPDEKA